MIGLGLLALVFLWFLFSRQPQTDTMTDSTIPEEEFIVDDTLMEGTLTLNLSEQNDSGQTGTATMVEADGQVTVTLSMLGFPEDTPQPAHIHEGVCPDVGAVSYPLTNLVNGESVTVLDVTLAQLESELPMGINVHQSVTESSVYTACGDLVF